ncbi:MAG: hypothetical protein ABSE63_02440 [Thermoguttaceae bacterium]|jgi:hypothetical protein
MTNPGDNSATPKPKLRWFQYRLSTLLLLITAAAIWLSFWTDRVRKQKQAVEFITRHGGAVLYSYQINAGRTQPTPPGPQWLRKLLGIDYLDHAASAYFIGDAFTDADLELLKALPNLQFIQINCGNVTNEGLVNLKHVRGLKQLEIYSDKINDDGLAHLQYLQELTDLRMSCLVTDAGMEQLMPLKNLRKLIIYGLPVGNEKGKIIEALTFPTQLGFYDTPLPVICDYLSEYHNIKLQIDKAALKDAKIDTKIPVTCTIKGVPLGVALHSMLESLGLDWLIGQDSLIITTRDIVAKRHKGVEKLQKSLPTLKQAYVDW